MGLFFEVSLKGGVKMSDKKGLIEDKKFWEYAIEIKIMGYDPVDVLKEFIRVKNPEYLEDD